jgi:translation initiation factor IF-2
MSKVRVYEVAKQLNMDQKTLVALFQSMGFGDVRNHMSAVESDVVDRVKRHLERQKAPEVVEERVRSDGRVVKRRARGPEGDGGGIPAPRPSAPGSSIARGEPVSTPGYDVPSTRHVPPPSHAGQRAAEPAGFPEAPPSAPSRRRAPAAPPSTQGRAAPPAHEVPGHRPGLRADEPPYAPVPDALPTLPDGAMPPAAAPSPAPVAAAHAEAAPAVGEPRHEEIVSTPLVAAAPVPSAPSSGRGHRAPASRARPSASKAAAAAAAPPPMEMFEPPSVREAPVAAPAPQPVAEAEPVARPAVAPPPPAAAEALPHIPAAPPPPTAVQAPPPSPLPAVAPTPPPPADGERTRETPRPVAQDRGPQRVGLRAEEPAVQHARTGEPAGSASSTTQAPRRPSQPPKTGIEYWKGRDGVPMPQVRTPTTPGQRRTVYDPRVQPGPQRPGVGGYGPARPGQRPGQGGRGQAFQGRGKQGQQVGPRKPAMVSTAEMSSHKKVIKIEEQVTLQQLAAKMSVKAIDVLMKLISLGMTGVHINSTLDADTAKILAGEFGWSVEDVAVTEEAALEQGMTTEAGADADLVLRPPIVTVMGHVDHGKTSLLDRIRKASVAEGEAGGITQHIGAYRVETPRGTIAFLDTPGHEAFTEMRARGAKVTDIVILVVAADDGVMPQTREAIAHAQAAKVLIVVAVNKIDKPGADPDKIKRDLASLGLQTEEWGGNTAFVNVSAKTGQGIEELLERVLLESEVLELKANPKKRASGTVIEALLDRGRGPVARVMVQDGTLHTGDILLAGPAWGKVRAMTDELGRTLREAGPSTPVEVLGLNEVPSAGDAVHAVKDARTAEEIADTRRKKQSSTLIPQDSRVTIEGLVDKLKEAEQLELKLIIKGDVQGSVEAVSHALAKLSTPKVKVTIVHAGVGGITEGDVNLAVASKAVIVGFNVRPAGKAASLAETEGIEIRLYNIIYNAVDDIRSAMEGLLPATKVEKILGRAEVRQLFRIAKVGLVCGCMVLSGTVRRTADARLIRDSVVVWTGKLSGLRRFKDDVKEVAEGFECGISIDGYQDVKEGDVVESFEIEEVKTKLS